MNMINNEYEEEGSAPFQDVELASEATAQASNVNGTEPSPEAAAINNTGNSTSDADADEEEPSSKKRIESQSVLDPICFTKMDVDRWISRGKHECIFSIFYSFCYLTFPEQTFTSPQEKRGGKSKIDNTFVKLILVNVFKFRAIQRMLFEKNFIQCFGRVSSTYSEKNLQKNKQA